MNDKKLISLLPTSNGTSEIPDDMIVKDLENIYKVYLEYMKEKNTASKLSLFALSVPYLVIVALVTAGVYKPEEITKINNLPQIIYGLITICGIFGIVPLFRFIELIDDEARCLRAINFLRSLYHRTLSHLLKEVSWPSRDLPIDSLYPSGFRPFSWSWWYVIMISLANAFYICFGIFKYKGWDILSVQSLIVYILIFALQYGYYIRNTTKKTYHIKPEEKA